jgi:hypothetical protein
MPNTLPVAIPTELCPAPKQPANPAPTYPLLLTWGRGPVGGSLPEPTDCAALKNEEAKGLMAVGLGPGPGAWERLSALESRLIRLKSALRRAPAASARAWAAGAEDAVGAV